jgi:hypothetical protein
MRSGDVLVLIAILGIIVLCGMLTFMNTVAQP